MGKAPGGVCYRHVIGAGIGAGEIEIDQPGHLAVQHQHIVGEQIGVDGRLRQAGGPIGGSGQPARHGLRQGGIDLAQAAVSGFIGTAGRERRPRSRAKRIGPRRGEIGQRLVHAGQRRAHFAGGSGRGFGEAHAGQEFDQAGRAAVQFLQYLPAAIGHRAGHGQALGREMAHQRQKPRQIAGINAFFIQGEDETAARGFSQEIAVFNAFRDALEADGAADIISSQKRRQIGRADRGVDGHGPTVRFRQ